MNFKDLLEFAFPKRFDKAEPMAAQAITAPINPPAEPEAKPPDEPQTATVGNLAREYDQHPARGMTPASLARLLVEAEQGDITAQLDLADDIEERDGHCFAEIDKRVGAVASLEWSLAEPENATADEKSITAQVNEWLMSVGDIEGIVRGMMAGALRGFSNHEMVWSLQERVQLPALTMRPHRWFTVDRETRNEMRLRTQHSPDGEPLIPLAWLHHVHKTRNGYLARGGLVRVLAWPYLFKNFATRDLAELLEIYGLPLRLGKYPSGAGDDEKRVLLRAVTQIGHNAAGIIPQGMTIDFENASTGNDTPFLGMVGLMEAIQSKVILGQTLSASEGKNGTQALGTVHNEVRMDIRDSDARQIAKTLTEQLVKPLALVNIKGADPRRLPVFQFDTTEPEDLTVYADTLPKLASAGLQIPVKWAQDKLRIPEPKEGEAVMKGTSPPAAPGAPADANADPKKTRQANQAALAGALPAPAGAQPRDLLDDLVDDAVGNWRPMLAPMVQPLLDELDRAVLAGESLADFQARLPELVTQMDYAPLGERGARASFVAALAGQAGLQLNGSGPGPA